ncbi:LysR substrate-binding domain-containing protein [Pseudomonas sp. ZM23]|uniref:LysR substrate-binding domain-containing protein n=1 Tax=Pseudomonas triclosanedens TaxID=2961893 RepID=A0ABY7A023_9PSED|nr:LysR substrate-binding domain-containing protein [Pseudomonas triclosanedens]MCP8462367.1 LysR substrate-binding domain-containing protein [Pseudomonas triclosanedens]MCP8468005.1 LysR substrate-binding domain-containing protein [Pseudomonas triclosanedens]MCP8474764.1 LysR substrate-binding domain-containing protein [Pseudomonas triclosanedens]WAI49563.1 LysR substrate-binding domain-containing protein [Pseudomonas triclosanedens]
MASYTLRQLKYFVTTVECGSVAEASRKLYIAQPSISTAIKGLEESFGVQLFIRHHAQGVSLTPSGARFYRKAQELLRMAHEFEQNALADNDVVAGQIDIGCFETVAPLYLPRLIAGFRERYPGVEIRISDGEQQELVQGLTAGRFDLALLYDHDLDGTIATDPLMPAQRPYALLPEDHRFARQDKVSLRDLALEPMILLDVQPSRTYFVSIFEELGLNPHIAFSSPSIEMVRGMVGQGFGFSLLVTRPHSECTYDGKKVVMVNITEDVSASGLVAAWLKRAQLTKPAQLFVDYAREELSAKH